MHIPSARRVILKDQKRIEVCSGGLLPTTTEISIWFPAQQRENKPERILWLKELVIELNPLPRRSLIQCLLNAQLAFARNFRCWEMHYLRRCVIPCSDN